MNDKSHLRSKFCRFFINFSILLIFIFGISNQAFSQRFGGGLKAGIVASEISGDELAGPNKLGWFAGVFTNYPLSVNSLLQLEIMYISKGSRAVPSKPLARDYLLKLDYAETSVLYKHKLEPFSSIDYIKKMTAEVGLSLGVLVDSYEVEDEDLVIDVSDERPFYGIEGSIWGGFLFPVYKNLSFNFRYSNSFTPARKHQSLQVVWYNWGQYHSLWTLGLEYTF